MCRHARTASLTPPRFLPTEARLPPLHNSDLIGAFSICPPSTFFRNKGSSRPLPRVVTQSVTIVDNPRHEYGEKSCSQCLNQYGHLLRAQHGSPTMLVRARPPRSSHRGLLTSGPIASPPTPGVRCSDRVCTRGAGGASDVNRTVRTSAEPGASGQPELRLAGSLARCSPPRVPQTAAASPGRLTAGERDARSRKMGTLTHRPSPQQNRAHRAESRGDRKHLGSRCQERWASLWPAPAELIQSDPLTLIQGHETAPAAHVLEKSARWSSGPQAARSAAPPAVSRANLLPEDSRLEQDVSCIKKNLRNHIRMPDCIMFALSSPRARSASTGETVIIFLRNVCAGESPLREWKQPVSFERVDRRIGQLYMISKHSHEQSDRGEGVEVVQNEPYEDPAHGKGQFTEKRVYLNSKLPSWARAVVPKIFYVTEKAWNYYPYTITEYTCSFLPKFSIHIETKYEDNKGCNDHIFDSEAKELEREVCFVDIARRTLPLIKTLRCYSHALLLASLQDLRYFKSAKTSRGLLKEGWRDTQDPIMCSYKLVTVKFEVWGLQTRVEQFVHKVVRDVLLLGHRQAFAWVDEWIDMTLDDVREYEKQMHEKTNIKVCHEQQQHSTNSLDEIESHDKASVCFLFVFTLTYRIIKLLPLPPPLPHTPLTPQSFLSILITGVSLSSVTAGFPKVYWPANTDWQTLKSYHGGRQLILELRVHVTGHSYCCPQVFSRWWIKEIRFQARFWALILCTLASISSLELLQS
ncbi:PITC1 protein, partial [Atractosteus spatula]|nr:PITC1 protein [Atractosteus spatula]